MRLMEQAIGGNQQFIQQNRQLMHLVVKRRQLALNCTGEQAI